MTVECVTYEEKMNCCRDLVGKIYGKRRCKTPSLRGADMDLYRNEWKITA
jgi:hypothetical protein